MGINFDWGKEIAVIRQGQHLSQRVLADKVKVNRSTLRRIENGQTPGNMDFIEKVLDHMGYELEIVEKEAKQDRLRRQINGEVDPKRRSQLSAQRLLETKMR